MESYEEAQAIKRKLIIKVSAGILALLLAVILHPFSIIKAGERGVVLRLGAMNRVMGEGLNWRWPLVEKVYKFDVKTQKYETEAIAYSKDIQTVDSTIALNYHLLPDSVGKLYQELGVDYRERVIDPTIQESVKAVTAQFTAQELIEERAKVKDQILVAMKERLTSRQIVVEDLSITNFDFSDNYEQAVEAKQVAQQTALKAANDLERVKLEAEQRVAQAKAEAEAIRIQAQAITQQGGKDYAQLKAIEKWNGVLPSQMIPGGTVPFLDLSR